MAAVNVKADRSRIAVNTACEAYAYANGSEYEVKFYLWTESGKVFRITILPGGEWINEGEGIE